MIETKFKVGDKVRFPGQTKAEYTVKAVITKVVYSLQEIGFTWNDEELEKVPQPPATFDEMFTLFANYPGDGKERLRAVFDAIKERGIA